MVMAIEKQDSRQSAAEPVKGGGARVHIITQDRSSADDQAINGLAANGHATNGNATNGHATNGHAANGHATNGHTTKNGTQAHHYTDRSPLISKQNSSPFVEGSELPNAKFPILHPQLPSHSASSWQEVSFQIDTRALHEACNASLGVEVETLLQAAFGVLLQGYMLSKDVCFDYIPLDRLDPHDDQKNSHDSHPGDDTLVCRITTDENDSFTALISRLHKRPHLLKKGWSRGNADSIDPLLMIVRSSSQDGNDVRSHAGDEKKVG
jgi:hypothetical protein